MSYLQFWSSGTELDWISGLLLFVFFICHCTCTCNPPTLSNTNHIIFLSHYFSYVHCIWPVFHTRVYIHTHILSQCLFIARRDYFSLHLCSALRCRHFEEVLWPVPCSLKHSAPYPLEQCSITRHRFLKIALVMESLS